MFISKLCDAGEVLMKKLKQDEEEKLKKQQETERISEEQLDALEIMREAMKQKVKQQSKQQPKQQSKQN